MDCSPPSSHLSMGFPRQENWSGLPFPSPGDPPNPGIKSASPMLTGVEGGGSSPLSHLGSIHSTVVEFRLFLAEQQGGS